MGQDHGRNVPAGYGRETLFTIMRYVFLCHANSVLYLIQGYLRKVS